MKLEEVSYEELEKFVLENMEYTYNVKEVLYDECNDLDDGCGFVFEMHDCKFEIKKDIICINEEDEEYTYIYDVEKL